MDKKVYRCETCDKTFTTKTGLNTHTKSAKYCLKLREKECGENSCELLEIKKLLNEANSREKELKEVIFAKDKKICDLKDKLTRFKNLIEIQKKTLALLSEKNNRTTREEGAYKTSRASKFEGNFLQFPKVFITEGGHLEELLCKTIKKGEFICDSDNPEVKRYLAKKALETFDGKTGFLFEIDIPQLEKDLHDIQEIMDEWKKRLNYTKKILEKIINEQ